MIHIMSGQTLRVLIVEDSEADTWLIVRELQRGGFHPDFERVENLATMRAALETGTWDLVISDYSLPQFGGPAALALCQQKGLDVPFISVSGVMGEEAAVAMMRAGAHDYVMKDALGRLVPAVARELGAAEERRVRRRGEAAMAHLAAIVESCDDAIISKSLDGTILSWNEGAERLYGYTAGEMIGRHISLLLPPDRSRELQNILESVQRGERREPFETVRMRKDRLPVDILLTVSPIKDAEGRVTAASAIARNISQRKREEQERLQLIQELTDALARAKTLGGLLPICASCKKIRNDNGYWQQVEAYVKEHSNAEFTHSLCPECLTRLYPELKLNT